MDIRLMDIQPSQLYLSEEKIRAVRSWFNKDNLSSFAPIPIKKLNGRIIFTDGHTRAWVAYSAGLEKVPVIWDEDDLDWEAYQICADACMEQGVCKVSDFEGRILSGADYSEKWISWCDRLHESLEQSRNK